VRTGYRSDLAAITLDEGSNTSWIMALKHGRYSHPIFDEIVIDYDRAERFVANERARVRGIQMDIDYDHKARRDDAAGWVTNVENRGGDVWYQVEWTDEAAKKIRNKEYKYFSSEFADRWTHPETGTTYEDVLFGGGLTNRPFIKGMVPVNLSESEAEQARLAEETSPSTDAGGATEGGAVDLTAIRTALKLSEGTSDEKVIETVLAKLTEAPAPAPEADDIKALAESNPLVAKMLAAQEESAKRLAEMETAMVLSEVRATLSEVDHGTEFAITPAAKSLAEPLMAVLPKSGRDKIAELLKQFAEGKGTVKLGETTAVGSSPADHGTSGDPVKKFTDLVGEVQGEEKGRSYKEAVRLATLRNPVLFSEYRKATDLLAGKEG